MPQGVPLDSLGVGAVEIGRNYAPDRRQHRQEAPKRIPATVAAFLHFFLQVFAARGGMESYLFVPDIALCLEGLKRQDTRGWFLTTRVFWYFFCLLCNGGMWCHRGVIIKAGADKEAAEKCFHVLATPLEALSAIRRRCWDMEALFSGFHIDEVGMGKVGSYPGRRLGRLVVSRVCGGIGGWCFVNSTQEQKKPCK